MKDYRSTTLNHIPFLSSPPPPTHKSRPPPAADERTLKSASSNGTIQAVRRTRTRSGSSARAVADGGFELQADPVPPMLPPKDYSRPSSRASSRLPIPSPGLSEGSDSLVSYLDMFNTPLPTLSLTSPSDRHPSHSSHAEQQQAPRPPIARRTTTSSSASSYSAPPPPQLSISTQHSRPLSPSSSSPPSSPRSAMKQSVTSLALLSDGGGGGTETEDAEERALRREQRKTRFRSPAASQEKEMAKDFLAAGLGKKKTKHATKSSASMRKSGKLTSHERHYLNKAFVYLQLQREWSSLSKIGTLTSYGSPFLPHPNGPNSRPQIGGPKAGGSMFSGILGGGSSKRKAAWDGYEWSEDDTAESPVLRYLFWRFIKNAPVMREAKPEYWTDQIQPFFDSFAERDLSTTQERSEVTKRRLIAMGLTRILGTYYSTCMTSSGRSLPARPSMRIMRRVDHLVPGSMESMWHAEFPLDPVGYNAWTAVVGEEDACFRIISRVLVSSSRPEFFVLRTWERFQSLAHSLSTIDPLRTLDLPLLPPSLPLTSSLRPSTPVSSRSHTAHAPSLPPPRTSLQRYLRTLIITLSTPPHDSDPEILGAARKDLEEFLLGQSRKVPARELEGYFELADREDRESEKKRGEWEGIGKRTKELRTTWALYKSALIEGDEIDKSVAITRRTPKLKDLPVSHRDAEEWVRIWVAYAFQFIFVSSPTAGETLSLLKGFHDLIPYAALKLGLMLVNPTLAIRAVVAIVLGQPIGQMSLFQRIFSIVVGGGIKTAKKNIEVLRRKLGHNDLADALHAHVYAPFAQRAATREASRFAGEDIVLTIVRDHSTPASSKLVSSWYKDFLARNVSEDKAEAQREDSSPAGRYQTLKNLLRAYCLRRDKEQVLEIAMERNTPILLKTSISVWYNTIYKVADASNLAARLGDLQAFVDDLIKVSLSSKNEAADFIKLCARHDQSLYFFAHELISNGGNLIDPLIGWCKSGLDFINSGVPSTTSSSKSPTAAPRRATVDYDELLRQATPETQAAILEEINDLSLVTAYKKAYADICLRADLLAVNGSALVLDRDALFADLLSQDHDVANYFERRGSGLSDRPEDDVSWAWFADDDVLNNPSAIKLDWKAAAAQEKAQRKKATPKNSFSARKGSLSRNARVEIEEKERMKGLPMPRVQATKTLLEDYLDVTQGSLDAAKRAQIK